MQDPTTLFTYEKDVDARSLRGTTLLVTVAAFADAGHAQQVIDEHLLTTLDSRVVGRLDLDQVHDYGAHRPEITLERDRFLDYAAPEIVLHEVTSPAGERFFLLTGPEPSFEWERVAAALRIVVEQLGIERTVLAQSFPAPVPHTRAVQVTAYADDPAHIRAPHPMPATFRLKSSFTHLLTLRLGEAGHETVGLVAHVPQYLHEMAYPDAAIALLRSAEVEGGITVPIAGLAETARKTRAVIDGQVSQASQLQELVESLERGYDRNLLAGADATASSDAVPAAADEDMPTDEQISAEIERFLADLSETPEPGEDGEEPAHQEP